MVDKKYCMSSYLALRYVYDQNILFKEGLNRKLYEPINHNQIKIVKTANDIYDYLDKVISEKQKNTKIGLLLSGGMDSACLAHFLKPGTDVYTFRYLGGSFDSEELKRAELFARVNKLKLHYVDIDFNIIKKHLMPLMKQKGEPVHSIEPQILEAALQAKKDGIEQVMAGDGADVIFGGLDKMLSKDWNYDDFKHFYIYLDPKLVLKEPVDMDNVFRQYLLPNNKIDFISFMKEVYAPESTGSYYNAIKAAKLKENNIFNPYCYLSMKEPLNLERIRNGESKYLIRELFKKCYPGIAIPEKIPMPRPVDYYFRSWEGPSREEFKNKIDMSKMTGNQKWQLWCLELFLNHYYPVQ